MSIDLDQVEKPARKIRKLLKKIGNDPAPEQVHHLRTNTRRLEASLAALSLDGQLTNHLKKALKRMRKRAGKVRDMDVLTSYVLHLNAERESDCSTRLLEHLAITRHKQARKLYKLVAVSGAQLRKDLKELLTIFDSALCESAEDLSDSAQAPAAATASALRLETKLASNERLKKNNLHPYRLVVKELRNVLRMSGAAANQEFVRALGEVKDSIGEWHNWAELLAISEKVLDHGIECQILRQLKRISEQKYRHALRQTEQMRLRYLGMQHGRQSRGLRNAASPLWRATSDLAA